MIDLFAYTTRPLGALAETGIVVLMETLLWWALMAMFTASVPSGVVVGGAGAALFFEVEASRLMTPRPRDIPACGRGDGTAVSVASVVAGGFASRSSADLCIVEQKQLVAVVFVVSSAA